MTASDQNHRSAPELGGHSLDYAIELLTFAATHYSKASLNPSVEEFQLVTDFVNLGLLDGEFVKDATGALTGILAHEISPKGAEFLARLRMKRNAATLTGNGFNVSGWLRRLAGELCFLSPA